MSEEAYVVSARKYRPQSFDTVVGQSALTSTLRNAISSGHLAHAYLFCGPRGVGKTTCARIFAKTINAIGPDDDLDQYAFNIHELDAASNNSVEDIRSIIREVMVPPQVGRYSVFIIDEVHMLSAGAFNALLKTLEEPPAYAIFILATTEKHKVPATILSRCQVYDFARITVTDIMAQLRQIAQREGISVTDESLHVIAQKADGGMRDALSIFDQLVSFAGTDISYERTLEILGVLDSDYYFRLVSLALAGDVPGALLLLDDVLSHGFDGHQFLVGLMQHLRDVLVSRDPSTASLLETSDALRARFVEQAQSCSPAFLFRALDILNTAEVQYRSSKSKRLSLELALIRLVAPSEPVPTSPTSQTPQTSQPTLTPNQAQRLTPNPSTSPTSPTSQPTLTSNQAQRLTPNPSTLTPNPSTPPPLPTAPTPPPAPFDYDRFRQAWIGLIPAYRDEIRLKAIIEEDIPVLAEDGSLVLTVTNPFQASLFRSKRRDILQRLHAALGFNVNLDVHVAEFNRDSVAYTAQDKYRLLLHDNPELDNLRQSLNLSLE